MSWETLQNTKEDIKQEEKPKMKIEFKTLSENKEQRGIKILSYGNFSTGKTHFALTSDKPVYIIDTENGASPLADKFPDAKILNICNFSSDEENEKDEIKSYEAFVQAIDYLCSLPDDEIGTIVVDSISDIWSWVQGYSKLKIFKLNIEDRMRQRFDWGIPNALIRKLVLKLINKNCNVIFTARENDIYDDASGPSGRVKPECQKKIPFYVDVVLHHKMKYVNKQLLFYTDVEKCRFKGELIGKTFENLTLTKLKEMISQK